jgi:hypothetical protein
LVDVIDILFGVLVALVVQDASILFYLRLLASLARAGPSLAH